MTAPINRMLSLVSFESKSCCNYSHILCSNSPNTKLQIECHFLSISFYSFSINLIENLLLSILLFLFPLNYLLFIPIFVFFHFVCALGGFDNPGYSEDERQAGSDVMFKTLY